MRFKAIRLKAIVVETFLDIEVTFNDGLPVAVITALYRFGVKSNSSQNRKKDQLGTRPERNRRQL